MKKAILLLLCFAISPHYAMKKPLIELASDPETQFWATKKSHEKSLRRLREESAEKIDLDALAQQIHYEIPKEWYYGRRINTLLVNACADDRSHDIVKQLLANHANPNAKINRELVKIHSTNIA